MADVLNPTSELDAVNVLLGTISVAPVNTLEDDDSDNATVDVVSARGVLRQICREVQAKGWDFNTEKDYPLSRDLEGKIKLPANLIRVVLPNCSYPQYDVIPRGGYLYDKKSHGFVFTVDIRATVTLLLSFEDLPEDARLYSTLVAARRFQAQTLGEDTKLRYTSDDVVAAEVAMRNSEAETGNYNYGQNFDVMQTINRNLIR